MNEDSDVSSLINDENEAIVLTALMAFNLRYGNF